MRKRSIVSVLVLLVSLTAFRAVEASDKELLETYEFLGKIYEKQGKYQRAIEVWQKGARLFPSNVGFHDNLAEIYWQERMYEQALIEYRRIVELQPEDYNSWLGVAKSQRKLKRYDRSLAICERLIRDSDWIAPAAQLEKGFVYFDQEEYEQARREYQKVIDDYPDSNMADDAQYEIGIAFDFDEEGQYERANGEYEKVINNYPDSDSAPRAQYAIAHNFYKQKRYKEAIDEFRKVVESYPQNERAPKAQYGVGRSFFLQGKFGQAIKEYKKVLELSDKKEHRERVYKALTDIYRRMGNIDELEKLEEERKLNKGI